MSNYNSKNKFIGMIKKTLFFVLIPFLNFGQTPCLDAIANATGAIGEFIPQCEEDGSYSPMQCWGSTGYCWCVDENGIEIAGTSLGPGEGLPNCAQQIDSLNILFLGNSYTASNNLPNMISTIANSMGDYLFTESNLVGGATLQTHVNNSNSNNLIMNGEWDYVVLQEQSQYPAFPLWQVEEEVFPYATQLNELITNYNNCGQTIFFMTWGRENGDQGNCANWPPVCTYEGMDDLIQERYIMMANENEAALSPVGAVWRYIRDYEYDIELYSPDGSHPSFLGSYVAAVCFYTTLFQKDPLEIPLNEDFNLSEDETEIIHQAVKIIVFDNFEQWNITSIDMDNDGVCNNLDNCPEDYNPNQADFDLDNIGDACDGIALHEAVQNKKLIKSTDLLGRQLSGKGFRLHVYDDGSVEKKYLVK
ncbi:MAG: hypothetical protein CMD23_01240 [Flavobacteriales bacterium]|nr:hypothetical protein [Flavobacteriales bacterium]